MSYESEIMTMNVPDANAFQLLLGAHGVEVMYIVRASHPA